MDALALIQVLALADSESKDHLHFHCLQALRMEEETFGLTDDVWKRQKREAWASLF
jgi:hypothetical protein